MSVPLMSAKTVYPRPRGGTGRGTATSSALPGLSPPTRGNRIRERNAQRNLGSIPAHAGEPVSMPPVSSAIEVYPRPRGGTSTLLMMVERGGGLSPPTRGNPLAVALAVSALGSIPAHAGEPVGLAVDRLGGQVYPRPRGGTYAGKSRAHGRGGLSPPTRGNLENVPRAIEGGRSIPAHAGEPYASPE